MSANVLYDPWLTEPWEGGAVNIPPTAYIDSISPNPATEGQTVSFVGHGADTDGTIVAYNWRSSIDGQLSTSASFTTSTLSVGTHTVYFKVQDNNGTWSSEVSETLVINPQPTLTVTISANPTTINSSETSNITITITDGTNPVTGTTVILESNNGGSFSSVTDNGDGTYTATFTAPTVSSQTVCRVTASVSKTDYNSGSGYVDVTVTVGEAWVESFYFVHLTDTHIGASGADGRFENCVKYISSFDPKPAFVLVTGDIADTNAAENYQVFCNYADTYLKNQGIPVYCCPGNHDYYQPYGITDDLNNYHNYIEPRDDYTLNRENVHLISLNSGYDTGWFKGSGLTDDQITWLEDDLDNLDGVDNDMDTSDYIKVIYMHHPAVNPYWWKSRVGSGVISQNRQEFVNICSQYGVHVVLTGHTHNSFIFDKNGNEWSGSSTGTKFVQTAAAMDYAYRNITIYGNTITVKSTEYFESTVRFTLSSPAELHVYDSQNRHVGGGECTIPNACYFNYTDEDGHVIETISLIYGQDDYTCKIIGTGNGTFNFTVENYLTNGTQTVAIYENVTITPSSEGVIHIYKESINYTINMDDDGDGIVDREIQPTGITVTRPEGEKEEEEGEEETKPPAKPSEIPWLYIIIPVVIIVILAAVAIGIKRRKKTLPPEKPAGK